MILVALLSVAVVFFILNKSGFIVNENIDENPDIPVTWNLDWQGGPGYDRYKILTEYGPYNVK